MSKVKNYYEDIGSTNVDIKDEDAKRAYETISNYCHQHCEGNAPIIGKTCCGILNGNGCIFYPVCRCSGWSESDPCDWMDIPDKEEVEMDE